MREIKFRAWDKEHNEMVYWDGFFTIDDDCCWAGNNPIYNLSKVPVMQYTGLKDKNGKEIYEGDIIAIYHTDKKYYGVKSLWQVTSNLTSWGYEFYWENVSGYECSTHVMREDPVNYEVIGNIYENPELTGS